jgi:mannose-6-phosphate isomerase-like protein (cupin superfamily)
MAKAGDNRFAFSTAVQAEATPCKVSSKDSGGACTIFELNALPRSGPFLHVHHREDEWYYVLSGEFLFRAGTEEFTLQTGGSIWLPRGIPHVWANTATTNGKLILMCQPGGFEKFFDDIGKVPLDKKSPDTMQDLMAKYGMEMLGPLIFASSWMKQHS